MSLSIFILGADCTKCNRLYKRVKSIVVELNINATVEKVTDTKHFIDYGIYSIPALVIDEKVVSKGIVPSEREIIQYLNNFLPETDKVLLPQKSSFSYSVMSIIIFISLFLAILLFFLSCNNKTDNSQNSTNSNIMVDNQHSIADSVNLLYNYTKQNTTFKITFLEFGSVGCIECKKMEKVLQEVKTHYNDKVNVVFYNARNKETKKIFKHFGIQLIPVQVLLDKNGKEYFRHAGYYSIDSVTQQIKLKLK